MQKSNLNGCTFYNLRWLLPLLLIPLLVFGSVVRYDDMVLSSSLKIGGSALANSKSAMEVTSTTKGVLMPRMTTTQRDAISGPPTSLMIFNTTTGLYEYWNGSLWAPMGGSTSVTGPATSTNNALAVWNGTTGTLLKDSLLTVSGSTITGNLIGNVTGAVTGNASTATALAANPTDCGADTYATLIDAGGNLTCSTVTNAGLAGSIAASKLIGSDIATVGTITSGTWSGTTILPTKGGTGFSTYALGDTLYSDASNSLAKLTGNITTTKKFLNQTGNGSVSAAPTWGQPACADLSNAAASCATDATNAGNISSGTLLVARGGTGQATLTNHGLLIGAGTTAITQSSVGATGTVLIGNTAADPTFSAGPIGLTSLGVNDSSGSSATYLKTSAIGVPTLTIKAIGSQTANMMEVLDSSGSPQMVFTSGGNFEFFHNVASPTTRMDLRGSVSQSSANAGNNARYGMFIGEPSSLATNAGSGIALGGPQTSSTDLTPYGYIWVNKNNATSGDVGGSLHLATRNNSTGNVQRAIEIDSSGNTDFFSSVNLNGSTSGKITTKAQAAAGTYEWDYPTTAGSSGNFLTSAGGAGSPMTWTSVVPIAAGGTNNGSLGVTAGGPLYTDGSKVINLGAGTAGQVIKSTGSAIQWGSTSGGLISDRELISNTDIEVDTTGYTAYADAAGATPVDCTGGSPNSTITRSTTTPISGVGELLWTKAGGANRQGEGFSIPFTVGIADQAKVLQIDLDTVVRSGTFVAGTSSVDSDLEFYIYDVTNSTIIQPTTYKVYSINTSIPAHTVSNFQTSSTGTSYRLCVHTATTTTANFTVGLDNISIHPSRYIYGSPITDWVSFTPTASWNTGVGTLLGLWRRVGSDMEVHTYIPVTGGVTVASLSMNMPTGYTIDSARLPAGNGFYSLTGTCEGLHSSSAYHFQAYYSTTSAVRVYYISGVTSIQSPVNATSPFTWANTDSIECSYKVPIAGWGASVQMSDTADQRTVAFSAYRASNQTGVNPNNTASKINIDTVVSDTHGAFSAANNNYVAPVPGYYVFNGCIAITTTNVLGSLYRAQLHKNGSASSVFDGATYQVTAAQAFNACVTSSPILLAAGDTMDIRLLGTGNNSASTLTAIGSQADTFFGGWKVQGPTAIGATETIAARYYATATAPGTTGSPTNTVFTTKDFDTHGAYSSGTYTIPAPGRYQFSACVHHTATTTAADQAVTIAVAKAGTAISSTTRYFTSSASKPISACVSDMASFVTGDTVTVQSGNNGTTPAISASNTHNYFSIYRVGL